MKAIINALITILLTFATSIALGQSSDNLQLSIDTTKQVLVKASRYQIVQSTTDASATFKLDTYSGAVYQMGTHVGSADTWEFVKTIAGSLPDIRYVNRQNYTLFVSGLGMRYVYLLNVHNGSTWQYVRDSKTQEPFFMPMVTNKH